MPPGKRVTNFMKQVVAHKKLGALQGALVILGLLAVLIALNYLSGTVLARWIGANPAALIFWLLGALVAWQVLRVYIVRYCYTLDSGLLRLTRAYGKRERHIEDIYLNQLLFVGDPLEAKKRFPGAKKLRALHVSAQQPVTAVVYKNPSGLRVALIQANEEIKAQLRNQLRNR